MNSRCWWNNYPDCRRLCLWWFWRTCVCSWWVCFRVRRHSSRRNSWSRYTGYPRTDSYRRTTMVLTYSGVPVMRRYPNRRHFTDRSRARQYPRFSSIRSRSECNQRLHRHIWGDPRKGTYHKFFNSSSMRCNETFFYLHHFARYELLKKSLWTRSGLLWFLRSLAAVNFHFSIVGPSSRIASHIYPIAKIVIIRYVYFS